MAGADALGRLIGVLGRDAAFLRLPRPELRWRLKLVYVKYRLYLAGLLRRPLNPRFRFLGRDYHLSTHTDGALLQRVLLDTHAALAALGLLGAAGIRAVDIGAHNGETVLAWSLYLDQPTIYAFEPDMVSFRNASLNTSELSVTLRQVGLSDRLGKDRLDVVSGHGGAATFAHDADGPTDPVEADIARGDDLLAGRKIDLVKIDVEGYERHVLEGLRRTLAGCRWLVMEVSLQRPKDHSFHELAAIVAEAKCELIATSPPHTARSGVQTAVDLYFRRSA